MLAIRNLSKKKLRTFFTMLGVALGIVSLILLASIGNGLLSNGGKLLEQSTIHLWVTGGATDIQSQYAGSSDSKISDAHRFVEDFRKNKEINMVTPMLTEMVYAFKNNSRPRAVFGLGIEGSAGTLVNIIQGKDLANDEHYNKGRFDGKWKKEILIDNRTANLLDVHVGDTIQIGKTLTEAKEQEFKIIGLTNSLSRFSSNPMVIFSLSEFQDITGNHYYDQVSMVMIRLKDPGKAGYFKNEIEQRYPLYTVSTNQEYLKKALKQNSLLIASAASIVLLAVIMGTLLVVNTMILSLQEKKREIAILKVIGMSRWSIFKSIGIEGLLISFLGGIMGILICIPLSYLI
ncbi:MAG: ABC transporter permease, partial [Euryarchaeota archaeon]|nr:ABC transporter permease [Euryarchaeota archaeon]